MYLVQESNAIKGVLEIKYMWLPLFIAFNRALLDEADKELEKMFPPPFELTEGLLKSMNEFLVQFLCSKFPTVKGLNEYLGSLVSVEEVANE